MYNDITDQEKPYWAGEVAEILGISDSTLRKYCLILEKSGYRFLRGDNGRRAFVNRDVIALKKFQELSQSKNVTLDDAAKAVISMIKDGAGTGITLADTKNSISFENRIQPLLKPLLEQNEMLRRELNEIRKQMTATHEKLDTIITETRAERQKKDRQWWQFWK